MLLYFSPGACSLAPRIIINEINLPSDFESVDLKEKKTATGEDFFKINPKGAVPVLRTDEGQILTENAVILQYLADQHQAHELLPPVDQFERYRVLEQLNYIATEMHKGTGILFNPNVTDEMKQTVILPLIQKRLDYLDKRLSEHDYIVQTTFTLPDAYLFVILRWLFFFKIDFSNRVHLSKYFKRINARDAVQKSLQQEG